MVLAVMRIFSVLVTIRLKLELRMAGMSVSPSRVKVSLTEAALSTTLVLSGCSPQSGHDPGAPARPSDEEVLAYLAGLARR